MFTHRLVRGDIYVHTVVIPEGFTMFDIAQAVQDAGLGSSQEFLEVAQSDVELISDLAPDAKSSGGLPVSRIPTSSPGPRA